VKYFNFSQWYLLFYSNTNLCQWNFIASRVQIRIKPRNHSLHLQQNPTYDSQVLSAAQGRSQFLWCSCTGATLWNVTALPTFSIYPCCTASWESCISKIWGWPWWYRIIKPGSKKITEQNGLCLHGNPLSLGNVYTRWHHHAIAQQLLCVQNCPPSPKFIICKNLQNFLFQEEKQTHFWSCHLQYTIPLFCVAMVRGIKCIPSEKNVGSSYVP